MLKKELEKKLEEAEAKVDNYQNDILRLKRELKTKEEANSELIKTIRFSDDQLKQLSQSIYTALQVKYPNNGSHNQEEVSEEERFLMFLHGLCVARNYNMNSVSDVFRHMS